MSQESRTSQIHIKRRIKFSSLQNEPSSAHNEPESSETSKKSKEQTSAPQIVQFSEELESTIPKTVNQKLKKEIVKLKRQNSQMEIDFEEKLEKAKKI
ncbi:hypothetical protein Glove_23g61 [Diversispora epigaea]|uniref:Uncharacterized protein n=1 Tax=Diversispora epigaea TaxID=1348612 RepID=A0A397JLX9_9GLOM|nr:hypothetical protein Glove_23g61 [Diversispora epigaea]